MAAENWIAHGQTLVPPGAITLDPECNSPGTMGEINSFPYTVPLGRKLVLRAQGVEGTPTPLSAFFSWLGNVPPYPPECDTEAEQAAFRKEYRRKNGLYTVQSTGGSREHGHFRFILPAGTVLHGSLTNATSVPTTLAWYLHGVLLDEIDDHTEWLK